MPGLPYDANNSQGKDICPLVPLTGKTMQTLSYFAVPQLSNPPSVNHL